MATHRPAGSTLFRRAGKWGPFRVSIPCGVCSLTVDVVKDTLGTELADIPVEFETRKWWKPLKSGGWHAPIMLVEGRLVSQGRALNRGALTEAAVEVRVGRSGVAGNALFRWPQIRRAPLDEMVH